MGKQTARQLIYHINYDLLKAQKTILVEMSGLSKLTEAQRQTVEGVLSLIDRIQDYAVEEFKLDKNKVFNFVDEKGTPNMTYHEAKEIVLNS